jgi:hypothetical protein
MGKRFNTGTQLSFLFLFLALVGAVAGLDQKNQGQKSAESVVELRATAGEAKTDNERNVRGLLIDALNAAAAKHANRASFCFDVSVVCLLVAVIMLAIFAGSSLAHMLAKARQYRAVE